MATVTPHNAPWRRALAALALLLGAALVLAFAPPASAGVPREGDREPTEIFVGRVQQVAQVAGQTPARSRLRFDVDVILLFGDTTVDTAEVVVHTTPGLDRCSGFPTSQETQRYLFTLTRQGDALIAQKCTDIREFSRQSQPLVVVKYGDPRVPGPAATPPPEPPALDPVTYTCPDTGDELTTVAGGSGDCDALSAPAATHRAAAPGLALVIVGLLGLVVVRRMGRRRRV